MATGDLTDNQTGLMWEKKTDSNVNDTYGWSSPSTGSAPDGRLFTSFLAMMRCDISLDGSCGLAGHYDWRIPNISELQTIHDCTQPNCLDPIFGPTAPLISIYGNPPFYWSASSLAGDPTKAWLVGFPGNVLSYVKVLGTYVRAVRGGR